MLRSGLSVDWANSGSFKFVESFNLKTMEWSQEADFPFTPVAFPTNIKYGNTFLVLGGYVNHVMTDHIFKVQQNQLQKLVAELMS